MSARSRAILLLVAAAAVLTMLCWWPAPRARRARPTAHVVATSPTLPEGAWTTVTVPDPLAAPADAETRCVTAATPPAVEEVDLLLGGLHAWTEEKALLFGHEGEIGQDHQYRVLQSNDGGRTWTRSAVEIPWGSQVSWFRLVSRDVAWIVTVHTIESFCGPSSIWRTTDGGRSWSLRGCPEVTGLTEPVAVCFTDALRGWIAVENCSKTTEDGANTMQVYETTDGGNAWTTLFDGPYDPHHPELRGILLLDAATTGLGDAGWRLVNVEGGTRWRVERLREPAASWTGVHEFHRSVR